MLRALLRSLATLGRQRHRREEGPQPDFDLDGAVVMAYVTPQSLRVTPNVKATSSTASARLRLIIPAREMARHLPVWILSHDDLLRRVSPEAIQKARAVVISKLPSPVVLGQPGLVSELLSWVKRQAKSIPLFADVADDFSQYPDPDPRVRKALLQYQMALTRHCHLVATCRSLRAALEPTAPHGVTVIEDPYESDEQPIVFEPADPIRLCWFGVAGPPTLQPLKRALFDICRAFPMRRFRLECVTGEHSKPLIADLHSEMSARHTAFEVVHTPWSLAATASAIARCDLVLLPQDTTSGWGKVKSHNRLVEAIRGGRLALASPIPSYIELSEFAWVGDDFGEGLAWALAHPNDVRQKLRAGQAYVADFFSPKLIGQKWLSLVSQSA